MFSLSICFPRNQANTNGIKRAEEELKSDIISANVIIK